MIPESADPSFPHAAHAGAVDHGKKGDVLGLRHRAPSGHGQTTSSPIPEVGSPTSRQTTESHTPKTYMNELPPELYKRVGESDDLLTQAVGASALLMLWAVWLTGSFSVFWFPYLLIKGACVHTWCDARVCLGRGCVLLGFPASDLT